MTRSYFAFVNYSAALLFTLATAATGFVVAPILIQTLGQERFGASRMLLGIFGYLSLLELGLGGALAPILARAAGEGNKELESKTLVIAVRAYLKVACASLLVGVGLSLVIWKLGLIQVSPGFRSDLLCACFLSLLGFLSLPCVPFRVLLDVRQAGYVVNLGLAGHAVLVAALAAWFATHRGGMSGQAAATSIGTISFYAVIGAAAARHMTGFVRAFLEPTDRGLEKRIQRLGAPSMILNVSGRLSVMSDDLIVGFMLEPAAVASFFVFGRLAGLVRQQLEFMVGSVWAGLINLYVMRDYAGFRKGIVDTTKTICVIGTSVLAPIIAFNASFVRLWVGELGGVHGAEWVCPWAAACAILVSLTALWSLTFTGTGRVRQISAQAAASAAINVIFSVLFTQRYGVVGPLLGTILASLALPIWYLPRRMEREFGVGRLELASAVVKPGAMGLLEACVLFALASARPPGGWLSLLLEAGAAGCACLALNALLCYSVPEREIWKNRARSIAAGFFGSAKTSPRARMWGRGSNCVTSGPKPLAGLSPERGRPPAER